MSIARARSLRRKMPPAEARLWTLLRTPALRPHHFRRQVPLGPYYADFASHGVRLVVVGVILGPMIGRTDSNVSDVGSIMLAPTTYSSAASLCRTVLSVGSTTRYLLP